MQDPFALHDTAALRELERRAGVLSGIEESTLMRRAGQAAWRCLLDHWPGVRRIAVLCGPGNNGGDGWVLARHAQESGVDVIAVQLPALPARTPLAQAMEADYRHAGGRVSMFEGVLPEVDLIVDALFGIGGDRAPEGETARLIEVANCAAVPILALDVPSGVDAERGAATACAIFATHTVEFIAAHAGLRTGAAVDHTGTLSLATLDLSDACFQGLSPCAHLQPKPRLPPRARDSHKGRFGHVLAIGGEHGFGGAIAIAADAALRSGCGLLSVATRAVHVPALLARRPEAMAHAVENPGELSRLIEAADVLALGPGLGRGEWGRAAFDAALGSGMPCVVDADALNLLAEAPRALPQAVLTPHPGEAARLLGVAAADIQADRFGAAKQLARRFECTVLLKGAGSIIAAPGATPRVVTLGNPGMASGGMGDALTGILAALRAQGLGAFEAASTGAWLHARAGDRAAAAGMIGLLASDLVAELRATLAECCE